MKIEANILPTTGSPQLSPRAAQAIAVAKSKAERLVPSATQIPLADAVRSVAHTQLPDCLTAHVALSIDKETGIVVGTVIDRESGKILRQIPSEEMVQLIRATREALGPLVDMTS